MDFSRDLEQFANRTIKKITKVKRVVAIKLFGAIVKGTPVGNPDKWKINQFEDGTFKNGEDDGDNNIITPEGYTGGRARANWNFSLNGFNSETTENTDASGGVTLNLLQTVALSADLDDSICMTNALPYIYRLEYDGWSGQAPEGMVRQNVIRFKENVRKAVAAGKSDFSL